MLAPTVHFLWICDVSPHILHPSYSHHETSLPVSPHEASIITNSSSSCQSGDGAYCTFQFPSNSNKFKSPVFSFPPLTHIFSFQSLEEGSGERCLKSTSDFISNTMVWSSHCAAASANSLYYVREHIPGVLWVDRFSFDKLLLSVRCRISKLLRV